MNLNEAIERFDRVWTQIGVLPIANHATGVRLGVVTHEDGRVEPINVSTNQEPHTYGAPRGVRMVGIEMHNGDRYAVSDFYAETHHYEPQVEEAFNKILRVRAPEPLDS